MFILNLSSSDQILVFSQYNCSIPKPLDAVIIVIKSIEVFSLCMTLCWYFSEVRVEGLETLDYLDNLQDRARFTEQGDAIVFESEVR